MQGKQKTYPEEARAGFVKLCLHKEQIFLSEDGLIPFGEIYFN